MALPVQQLSASLKYILHDLLMTELTRQGVSVVLRSKVMKLLSTPKSEPTYPDSKFLRCHFQPFPLPAQSSLDINNPTLTGEQPVSLTMGCSLIIGTIDLSNQDLGDRVCIALCETLVKVFKKCSTFIEREKSISKRRRGNDEDVIVSWWHAQLLHINLIENKKKGELILKPDQKLSDLPPPPVRDVIWCLDLSRNGISDKAVAHLQLLIAQGCGGRRVPLCGSAFEGGNVRDIGIDTTTPLAYLNLNGNKFHPLKGLKKLEKAHAKVNYMQSPHYVGPLFFCLIDKSPEEAIQMQIKKIDAFKHNANKENIRLSSQRNVSDKDMTLLFLHQIFNSVLHVPLSSEYCNENTNDEAGIILHNIKSDLDTSEEIIVDHDDKSQVNNSLSQRDGTPDIVLPSSHKIRDIPQEGHSRNNNNNNVKSISANVVAGLSRNRYRSDAPVFRIGSGDGSVAITSTSAAQVVTGKELKDTQNTVSDVFLASTSDLCLSEKEVNVALRLKKKRDEEVKGEQSPGSPLNSNLTNDEVISRPQNKEEDDSDPLRRSVPFVSISNVASDYHNVPQTCTFDSSSQIYEASFGKERTSNNMTSPPLHTHEPSGGERNRGHIISLDPRAKTATPDRNIALLRMSDQGAAGCVGFNPLGAYKSNPAAQEHVTPVRPTRNILINHSDVRVPNNTYSSLEVPHQHKMDEECTSGDYCDNSNIHDTNPQGRSILSSNINSTKSISFDLTCEISAEEKRKAAGQEIDNSDHYHSAMISDEYLNLRGDDTGPFINIDCMSMGTKGGPFMCPTCTALPPRMLNPPLSLITTLNLSYNSLQTLPNHLPRTLSRIDLSHNCLTAEGIGFSFLNCRMLFAVNLRHNALKSLLFCPSCYLDCGDSEGSEQQCQACMRTFPTAAPDVHRKKVATNGLVRCRCPPPVATTVPSYQRKSTRQSSKASLVSIFQATPYVRYMFLGRNQLTSSEGLSHLYFLEYLDIGHNRIRYNCGGTVKANGDSVTSLRSLSLNVMLKHLILDGNPVMDDLREIYAKRQLVRLSHSSSEKWKRPLVCVLRNLIPSLEELDYKPLLEYSSVAMGRSKILQQSLMGVNRNTVVGNHAVYAANRNKDNATKHNNHNASFGTSDGLSQFSSGNPHKSLHSASNALVHIEHDKDNKRINKLSTSYPISITESDGLGNQTNSSLSITKSIYSSSGDGTESSLTYGSYAKQLRKGNAVVNRKVRAHSSEEVEGCVLDSWYYIDIGGSMTETPVTTGSLGECYNVNSDNSTTPISDHFSDRDSAISFNKTANMSFTSDHSRIMAKGNVFPPDRTEEAQRYATSVVKNFSISHDISELLRQSIDNVPGTVKDPRCFSYNGFAYKSFNQTYNNPSAVIGATHGVNAVSILHQAFKRAKEDYQEYQELLSRERMLIKQTLNRKREREAIKGHSRERDTPRIPSHNDCGSSFSSAQIEDVVVKHSSEDNSIISSDELRKPLQRGSYASIHTKNNKAKNGNINIVKMLMANVESQNASLISDGVQPDSIHVKGNTAVTSSPHTSPVRESTHAINNESILISGSYTDNKLNSNGGECSAEPGTTVFDADLATFGNTSISVSYGCGPLSIRYKEDRVCKSSGTTLQVLDSDKGISQKQSTLCIADRSSMMSPVVVRGEIGTHGTIVENNAGVTGVKSKQEAKRGRYDSQSPLVINVSSDDDDSSPPNVVGRGRDNNDILHHCSKSEYDVASTTLENSAHSISTSNLKKDSINDSRSLSHTETTETTSTTLEGSDSSSSRSEDSGELYTDCGTNRHKGSGKHIVSPYDDNDICYVSTHKNPHTIPHRKAQLSTIVTHNNRHIDCNSSHATSEKILISPANTQPAPNPKDGAILPPNTSFSYQSGKIKKFPIGLTGTFHSQVTTATTIVGDDSVNLINPTNEIRVLRGEQIHSDSEKNSTSLDFHVRHNSRRSDPLLPPRVFMSPSDLTISDRNDLFDDDGETETNPREDDEFIAPTEIADDDSCDYILHHHNNTAHASRFRREHIATIPTLISPLSTSHIIHWVPQAPHRFLVSPSGSISGALESMKETSYGPGSISGSRDTELINSKKSTRSTESYSTASQSVDQWKAKGNSIWLHNRRRDQPLVPPTLSDSPYTAYTSAQSNSVRDIDNYKVRHLGEQCNSTLSGLVSRYQQDPTMVVRQADASVGNLTLLSSAPSSTRSTSSPKRSLIQTSETSRDHLHSRTPITDGVMSNLENSPSPISTFGADEPSPPKSPVPIILLRTQTGEFTEYPKSSEEDCYQTRDGDQVTLSVAVSSNYTSPQGLVSSSTSESMWTSSSSCSSVTSSISDFPYVQRGRTSSLPMPDVYPLLGGQKTTKKRPPSSEVAVNPYRPMDKATRRIGSSLLMADHSPSNRDDRSFAVQPVEISIQQDSIAISNYSTDKGDVRLDDGKSSENKGGTEIGQRQEISVFHNKYSEPTIKWIGRMNEVHKSIEETLKGLLEAIVHYKDPVLKEEGYTPQTGVKILTPDMGKVDATDAQGPHIPTQGYFSAPQDPMISHSKTNSLPLYQAKHVYNQDDNSHDYDDDVPTLKFPLYTRSPSEVSAHKELLDDPSASVSAITETQQSLSPLSEHLSLTHTSLSSSPHLTHRSSIPNGISVLFELINESDFLSDTTSIPIYVTRDLQLSIDALNSLVARHMPDRKYDTDTALGVVSLLRNISDGKTCLRYLSACCREDRWELLKKFAETTITGTT